MLFAHLLSNGLNGIVDGFAGDGRIQADNWVELSWRLITPDQINQIPIDGNQLNV